VDEFLAHVCALGGPDVLLEPRHERHVVGDAAQSVIAAWQCRFTSPE
jgi:hypothetical protein